MSKKKIAPQPVLDEPIVIEPTEVEIEEVEPIEIEEEEIETVEEEPKQEEVKAQGKSDREKFIEAQLKVINQMDNPARQKRLAERVLRK